MFPTDFSPAERRRLLVLSTILFLVLTLPYLWAWLLSPGDGVYSGFLYNPDDQNVHLSWARQARDGAFFFRDLFTTEWLQSGERPLFTNLLCWAMGALSRVTTLPLIWIYHGFRVVFAILALWWFAALCAHLTQDKRVRFTAVALAAFGGGAGFLAPLFPNRIFIDRADNTSFPMMPEAFTFASAFVFPLFIVSVALLPLIYLLTLRAQQTGKLKWAFIAAIAAFILTNIHTYDALPLDVVMLIWAISSTRMSRGEASNVETIRARTAAPLFVILGTLPMLIYQRFVVSNSEEFRVKALSPKPAPPFFDLFLSLSPLLLLAMVGAYFIFRRREEKRAHLMTLWAFVTLAMVYINEIASFVFRTQISLIPFARKMIEGVHLPLCFLAALGLVHLLDRFRVPRVANRVLVGGFVALMSVSSAMFVAWCLDNARDNNQSRVQFLMPPLYLPIEAVNAMQALNNLDEPRNRAVLCLMLWGNYIPPMTGFPVYTGHFDETLHVKRKNGEALQFLSGQMDAAQSLNWLRQNDIGFVLIGPNEKAAGARDLPFPTVWHGGQTTVYRVP